MRIEWSEPAMLDMAALRNYIAEDSPFRAKLFIQRLFEHVDHLKSFPELGRVILESNRPDVRELVFQGYRIIYQKPDRHPDRAARQPGFE